MTRRGTGKYGVISYLPDGRKNPEWRRRFEDSRRGHPAHVSGDNRYGVPARLPDGRDNSEYSHRKYLANRKHRRQMGRIWYEKNRDVVLKQVREYNLTHAEERKRQNREWMLRHPGYNTESIRRWRRKNPARNLELTKRHNAKRKRGLPTSIILGERFSNSVLHHLSPDLAIYIPRAMHKSVQHNIWTGRGMNRINALAWAFYEPKGEILPIHA
jgi:hypothetical protein